MIRNPTRAVDLDSPGIAVATTPVTDTGPNSCEWCLAGSPEKCTATAAAAGAVTACTASLETLTTAGRRAHEPDRPSDQ